MALLVVLPACVGWVRATRPFSERTNRWFSRDVLILTRDSASALRCALRDGTLADWVGTSLVKTMTHESHKRVSVWYCPRPTDVDEPEPDVYLSLDGRPIHLTPEESAAVATAVPALTDLAIPGSARYATRDDGADDPTMARLLRVPGDHVGRAKKTGVILRGRAGMYAITFSPILLLFVIAGSAYLLHLLFDLLGVPNEVLVVIFGVVGIALVIQTKRWFNPDNDITWRYLVWYYRRVIAGEIAARDDALFPPDGADVVYTEVIPRRAWSDLQAHRNECEGGLLLVDAGSQALLFEGDRYRYVIPAGSIRRYAVEEVVTPNVQNGTTAGFFAVVLVVRTADGDRELPLSPMAGIEGHNRWEKAMALQDRVTSAFGWGVEPVPASPPAGHMA